MFHSNVVVVVIVGYFMINMSTLKPDLNEVYLLLHILILLHCNLPAPSPEFLST